MKRIFILMAILTISSAAAVADDKPITFDMLPQAAKAFINTNFPDAKVTFVTQDDDLIRPEYQVVMSDGVMIQFENDGRLEKIETRRGGIPDGIIPPQLVEIVKEHYPGLTVIEYEVGKKTYEVILSNGMELEFNKYFNMIEIDD